MQKRERREIFKTQHAKTAVIIIEDYIGVLSPHYYLHYLTKKIAGQIIMTMCLIWTKSISTF